MTRFALAAGALFLALTACGKGPHASNAVVPVAKRDQAELGVEQIKNDLLRRRVPIYGVNQDLPDDVWKFDTNEPKQVQILEQQVTSKGLTVVILMTTGDDPQRDEEEPIEVSGKLRLNYLKQGSRFILKDIENLSFRYSVGVSI